MKIGNFLLAIAMASFIGTPHAFSESIAVSDSGGTGGGGIVMGTASAFSVSTSEISILLTEQESLESFFHSNLGTLKASIKGSPGNVVYSKSVDTSLEQDLYIDLLNLKVGSYSLSFTDEVGKVIKTFNFEIK